MERHYLLPMAHGGVTENFLSRHGQKSQKVGYAMNRLIQLVLTGCFHYAQIRVYHQLFHCKAVHIYRRNGDIHAAMNVGNKTKVSVRNTGRYKLVFYLVGHGTAQRSFH
jgi:hypothetical protein